MENRKSVFVIMPFSSTKTCTDLEWTEIYEYVFKPAIEDRNYKCERAIPETGSLIKTIIGKVKNSAIVIADITDRNANVLYELGVRHSLCKGTIIVSQCADDIPSDLKGYWSIIYGTKPAQVAKFKEDINRVILGIEGNPDESDSPIWDFVFGFRGRRIRQKKAQEFNMNYLSLDCMKNAAHALWEMVDASRFEPDIVITLNQGGLFLATACYREHRKPIGIIQNIRIDIDKGSKVEQLSLPLDIKEIMKPSQQCCVDNLPIIKPQNERILVFDIKLKTGYGAKAVKDILQCIYGENVDIRYAFGLVYVGGYPQRLQQIKDSLANRPIDLQLNENDPLKLKVYTTYYIDTDPKDDNIWEEMRHPDEG